MASVASSSSSFSTRLLLHPSTALLSNSTRSRSRSRRRSRPNFVRIVTRSCLDDSSALLRAAQYTVIILDSHLQLSNFVPFCIFLRVINIWFFMHLTQTVLSIMLILMGFCSICQNRFFLNFTTPLFDILCELVDKIRKCC